MKDSQILSTLQTAPNARPLARPAPVLVYDACQLGVTLLTVLFVELVVGVGAMFGASGPLDWLGRLALLTGGALPATLAWLIVGCSLKFVLARLRPKTQYALGVLLGALAGMAGCAILALIGVLRPGPWLASGCAGALLAAILVAEAL